MNNVTTDGKTKIMVPSDFVSNGDFAVEGNTLYLTCDTHPFSGGALSFISDTQSVYAMSWDRTFDGLSNQSWSKVTGIGQSATGHAKNHNGGFCRDGCGNLTSHNLYVSTADELGSDYNTNLWTYRFMKVSF